MNLPVGADSVPSSRIWRRAVIVAAALLAGSFFACASSTSTWARSPAAVSHTVGPIADISLVLSGQYGGNNAEVEQAIDPTGKYVYDAWMDCSATGCQGIGFARSIDGGKHFGRPMLVPGSPHNPGGGGNGWDPAVTVAANGAVYVAFMVGTQYVCCHHPVVAASFDHGRTFSQVSSLLPPPGNWGDRDFIAAGPHGVLYLTWDYGPSWQLVKDACPPAGSCYFAAGDFNVVIQKSTDGGKTWGPITPVSPRFPNGGADSGPLVVEPNGRVDVVYQGYQVSTDGTDTLGSAHSYFTSSTDGGRTWSAPLRIGPAAATMSKTDWWINGDISMDRGGNLYATWDTQSGRQDTGWLSYSTNRGKTWSKLLRVTPDTDNALHIVQSAGEKPGMAYVGWLSNSSPRGYALYLREFSIKRGWLTPPIQVSRQFGSSSVWPGDTFGIAAFPGTGGRRVAVSWGSAVGGSTDSQIFATVVGFKG